MSTTATAKVTAAVTWFEIPVADIDRATRFYETVLDTRLKEFNDGGPMRIFPAEEGSTTGALVHRPPMKPSMNGTTVYLHCPNDLAAVIARVAPAGGSIGVPQTPVPGEKGHFFVLRDTEGNHVGIHKP